MICSLKLSFILCDWEPAYNRMWQAYHLIIFLLLSLWALWFQCHVNDTHLCAWISFVFCSFKVSCRWRWWQWGRSADGRRSLHRGKWLFVISLWQCTPVGDLFVCVARSPWCQVIILLLLQLWERVSPWLWITIRGSHGVPYQFVLFQYLEQQMESLQETVKQMRLDRRAREVSIRKEVCQETSEQFVRMDTMYK